MDFLAQYTKQIHAKTIIIADVASINTPAPIDIATIAPKDKAASPGLVVGVLDEVTSVVVLLVGVVIVVVADETLVIIGGIVVELSMKQNIQYNYNPYS